jgi:ATP-dependent Clp protease ATP-binding subunit ClpX
MKYLMYAVLGIAVIWLFPKLLKVAPKLCHFLYYVFKDAGQNIRNRGKFNQYGVTMYCGRQGTGKTVGMVEYLERMRVKYPKVLIYTNFGYRYQTGSLDSWRQLITVRSPYGVIFAIDEIQAELSSSQWQSFPPELLREISQQRKQGVKIIAAAQCYKDVAVQIRRQTFNVVEARTLAGRWTIQKCLDADDYNRYIESTASPEKKMKIRRLWRRSFIQSDRLRGLYDTKARVERMLRLQDAGA